MASRANEINRPYDSDEDKSVEEIERDIEATRADMSKTIDAIEAKLSPERLKQQALEGAKEATEQFKESLVHSAREATEQVVGAAQGVTQQRTDEMLSSITETVGVAGSSLSDMIKRNPVPAALAAIGIGWLIMDERSSSRDYDGPTRRSTMARQEYRYTTSAPASYGGSSDSGLLDDAKEKASQLASDVQSAVSDVKDKAGDLASDVKQRAEQAQSQASDLHGDARRQLRQQARRLPSRFEQMVDDNPLGVGMVALGIGAAIGLALPETEAENRLMGEISDDLTDRAQQVAEKAKSAAEQTMKQVEESAATLKESAKQEVEQRGLVEKAKSAADQTVSTAKEAAQSTQAKAKTEAKALADEAKTAAKDVKDTAKDELSSDADSGS